MPKEANLELKVGVFVISAVVGLAIFILSVGDFAMFEKGMTVQAVFEFAGGVRKSAPVRMAGVETGRVKAINLFFDREEAKTKAEVILWLHAGTKVPADSVVMINQLGPLGEKYVEILPGVDRAHFVKDGDVLTGRDPIVQELMAQKLLDVSAELETGVKEITDVVGNRQESLRTTIGRLDRILAHVESGEGTIGRLFYDDQLYQDMQEMMADLKENPWKLLYRPEKR